MKKITDFIVEHCYAVLVVMVALAGLSAFVSQNVNINHDIMKYMPESSETSQGKKIMDEEFGDVATSNYTIMFENLDESEKDEMKNYFETVDDVETVSYDESENYNREVDGTKYTLYSISVKGEADGTSAKTVYDTIHNHLKDAKNENGEEKYTFFEKGDVATSNGSVLNIVIIILAIGVALLIITIMSESYIEPWLYLTSILIAVLINKGTNIIFPSVSHITDSIAAILQLALSMDYSIMLAERYRQERKLESNKVKAMKNALSASFSSISASSVTTIVGLAVLIFMSFTIGRDMGLVLSKGVLLSLVSIFTTLPAFLLLFDKKIIGSKKKSPRFNMGFMGKWANFIRFAAIPAFLIVFGGSMILKGNVGIEYTGANNNKISEIFDETNQIAIIYNNEDEARLAKICKTYDKNDKVKEALCFGNTIGEQMKYDELKGKADDLGSEMNVDDYLIKTLYYHYYDPNETNEMTLEEFVTFIQEKIMNDKNFSADISSNMRSEIERLSNFVVKSKMNKERSLSELAKIFEMDESSLKKVFVLYANNEKNSTLGKSVSNSTMTLAEFANFVNNVVLKDSEYSKEVSSSAKTKLALLSKFTNKSTINKNMNASELSNLLSIDKSKVGSVFQYEAYLNHVDEIATAKQNGESQIQAEITVQINNQAETVIAGMVAQAVANGIIPDVEAAKTAYADAIRENVRTSIRENYGAAIEAAVREAAQPTIDATTNQIMAQIAAEAAEIKNSPVEFVNFILDHQNDEMLAGNLDSATKTSLKLAKTVMDAVNSNKKFTYTALAKTFNLDASQLRLLYSLNYFTNINKNPKMTVRTLVEFLNSSIINNEKYNKSLSSDQKQTLTIVTDLMNHSISNDKYTAKKMFDLLSPLSNNLKSELIDLLYMYHGSLYHYDDSWTLSLEQFINYLHGTILKDKRFDDKIDSSKKETIEKANDKISDAKKLLV